MKSYQQVQSKDNFSNKTNGLFHKDSVFISNIERGTPIAPPNGGAIDPGHINVISSCIAEWGGNNDPITHTNLSLNQYYSEIGIRRYSKNIEKKVKKRKINELLDQMSQTSLKTCDAQLFLNNIEEQSEYINKVLSFYRSNFILREKFEIRKRKDRFYSKIANVIAPHRRRQKP